MDETVRKLKQRSTILKHFTRNVSDDYDCFGRSEECGEQIAVYLKIKNGTLEDAVFGGMNMSFILKAIADIILDAMVGRKVEELKHMKREDWLSLSGLEHLDPTKRDVAYLAIRAIENALSQC